MTRKRSRASKKAPKKVEKNSEGDLWSTPCLICDSLDRCGVGQQISPISCAEINHWILLKGRPAEEKSDLKD